MSALNQSINTLDMSSDLSLILTVFWLIEETFAVHTISPVLIGNYATTKSRELAQNDIIEEILRRTSQTCKIKVSLEANYESSEPENLNNDSIDEKNLRLGQKDKVIWFIDSLDSFAHLESNLMDERLNYKRNGLYCIVYTGLEPNRLQRAHSIFGRLFEIYVINVNLLLLDGKTTHAYTYFPFLPHQCHNSSPRLVGSLGPSTAFKFSQATFFNKKLNNMWGCKLTVSTWNEPPFVILKNDKITGIEGLLLVELSKRMNFTIDIKAPPANDRGIVYANKTATGVMKMLIEKETNITINCLLYDKNRLKVADAAYTYLSAPFVVAMTKGRRMTPFERLIRPFRFITWICLSSSLIFGILLIFILKYYFKPIVQRFFFGAGNRIPCTNLWNLFYGGNVHGALPTRNFARYILMLWIIYTWIMRTVYISQLFLILQDARARSNLKTLSEVIERNYTFFTYPILVPVLNDRSKKPEKVYLVNSAEYTLDKLFKRLGREDEAKFVVTMLGHLIRNYNQQPENRQYQISILPEPILVAPLTFYMTRHSYFSQEINPLLLRIMAVGLIGRFEDLSLDSFMLEKEAQEPALLSVWLLFGIFSLYLVLLVLCLLIFLLELWSTRSQIARNIIEFFNC